MINHMKKWHNCDSDRFVAPCEVRRTDPWLVSARGELIECVDVGEESAPRLIHDASWVCRKCGATPVEVPDPEIDWIARAIKAYTHYCRRSGRPVPPGLKSTIGRGLVRVSADTGFLRYYHITISQPLDSGCPGFSRCDHQQSPKAHPAFRAVT